MAVGNWIGGVGAFLGMAVIGWAAAGSSEPLSSSPRTREEKSAPRVGRSARRRVEVSAPWRVAVPYGEHPRQVLDVYRPAAIGPCPVVYFVHGGGWTARSRTNVHDFLDVPNLLSNGIAVVAPDYRLVNDAKAAGVEPPVRWPLEDAARALQFTRAHAAEWGLDKTRIAGSGGSAGGCSVLWLALHDDMARPDSSDAVARESTRLCFVAAVGAQTSLDPVQMREWMPNITYGAHAFGCPVARADERATVFESFLAARERLWPVIREYSPIEHASADDPPLWLYYGDRTPVAKGDAPRDPTHSALFGLMLRERLAPLGVPVVLTTPARPEGPHTTLTEALTAALTPPPQGSTP